MRDIWSFFIQTLTVSGVAAVVLVIKALLRDKLSPRWQFSVWAVVAMVLMIPAGIYGRYILFDWPLLVESVKTILTGEFSLSPVTAPIPLFPANAPKTFGDWLFVLYFAGVLVLAAYYLLSYGKLRRILRRGEAPDAETAEKIRTVQSTYHLRCCRVVMVPGLESAFVCGVFRPVLALPGDRQTDEKVLLHEMLHLRYKDAVWGIVICLFRCIHWCNPFLWHCANLAGNDMESLCDQRVLERLQGEERRDYGRILLSMANEKYARAPGTSSAANGGKNIRRRIEAIARFKRYPAGMALVCVCILIVLTVTFAEGRESRNYDGDHALQTGCASARLTRCTTPEGAVDSYAKAIFSCRGDYRLMCAPQSQWNEIIDEMQDERQTTPYWDPRIPESMDVQDGYHVYDVSQPKPQEYRMLLVMKSAQSPEREGCMRVYSQMLNVSKEGDRWIAQPQGPFQFVDTEEELLKWGCRALPAYRYSAVSGDFKVTIYCQQHFEVSNRIVNDGGNLLFPAGSRINTVPMPHARFDAVSYVTWATLTYLGAEEDKAAIHQCGISYSPWQDGTPRPQLSQADSGTQSSSSNTGDAIISVEMPKNWDNYQQFSGSGISGEFDGYDTQMPSRYAADLYVNGQRVSELTMERETVENE